MIFMCKRFEIINITLLRKFVFSGIIFCLLFSELNAQNTINIIPQPVKVKESAGTFMFGQNTEIMVNTELSEEAANIFNDHLQKEYGFKTKITENNKHGKAKVIVKVEKDSIDGYYKLVINNDEINISGNETGIFYAFQTLSQMLYPLGNSMPAVHYTEIIDYPRYKWRGMHLDVSRHFVGIDSIKKYIDYLSYYKMNVFHWHLTDDQGWRIEIKKYPKLTQVGGYRNGTLLGSYSVSPQIFDTIRYGGFYTQQEIKEIVEYARKRHVTIVPEIEMPGHSLAALSAYPEYSCTGGPFEPAKLWGVFDDVFCVKDETIQFLSDILNEVMDLFPGEYIHIGGDECPKIRWKSCTKCQEIKKRQRLINEDELQSYFIRRIEKIINAKGKKIIGWDEILEGGLAPNAAVMSWRGIDGGLEAAKQNHYVVMTPGSHCYFDHYQGNPKSELHAIGGYTTVEKVYSFEPTPTELSFEQQKYILGAQGNVWTEYMSSFRHVEYMIFPRLCALSEVLWSPKENRNWEDFKKRLTIHLARFDSWGINYSKALYEVTENVTPNDSGVLVELASGCTNGKIVYTIDNSMPNLNSDIFKTSIPINNNSTLKAVYCVGNKCIGSVFEQVFIITKSTGKKITLAKEPHKNYNTGGAFTLVDGILGRIPWYGKEWLGFSGDDMEATIDLGNNQVLKNVKVNVLSAEISWIYLPKSMEVLVSLDGKDFKSIGSADSVKIQLSVRTVEIPLNNCEARYVKVIVKNYGDIPKGKPGEGNKAWLFVDEIQIQ